MVCSLVLPACLLTCACDRCEFIQSSTSARLAASSAGFAAGFVASGWTDFYARSAMVSFRLLPACVLTCAVDRFDPIAYSTALDLHLASAGFVGFDTGFFLKIQARHRLLRLLSLLEETEVALRSCA